VYSKRRLTVVFEVDEGNEVEVEVDYYPGDPGRRYMPNGDPGYPPEPAEIDLVECRPPCDNIDAYYDYILELVEQQLIDEADYLAEADND